MSERDQQEWADKAAQALRDEERNIDDAHLHPLRMARQNAVAAAQEAGNRRTWQFKLWMPITGVGALACAAVLSFVMLSASVDTLPLMDDVEMAAAQDVEVLEALEFAAWMVAMEEAGELPNQG